MRAKGSACIWAFTGSVGSFVIDHGKNFISAVQTGGVLELAAARPKKQQPPDPRDKILSIGPPFCGRVKYHYPLTEPIQLKASVLEDLPDFVKSHEYYGSGRAANRFILARNRVVRLIRDKGLRGLGFRRPVHLV